MIGTTTLAGLPFLRDYHSKRASSFDTTGNNSDFWYLEPGQTKTLFEARKSGCIKHIWVTVGGGGPNFLRTIVLRMHWDDETDPSVHVPLGDFFGLGHGRHRNFVSLPLQMSPNDGRGMNCWWPMPYGRCMIEVENQGPETANFFFYIDYEEYEEEPHPKPARFHAQWRRENPTTGWLKEKLNNENLWDIWSQQPNTTGDDNYVILEAEGNGIYVGCHLDVDCFSRQGNDWFGEGDDMIFIDGEAWPPSLHGTGTEDYFNTAFCPQEEYNAPYHGLILYSGNSAWPWKGKNSLYRYHIEDPIRFHQSIRVTIEHGHANKLSNDFSSTAYWYQEEPHKPQPALLSVEHRLPRPDEPAFLTEA